MDECKNRAGSLEWKEGKSDWDAPTFQGHIAGIAFTGSLCDECAKKISKSIHISDRQPEIDALKAEVAHWKANHDNMVNRSRVLIDRPDLPLERVKAFEQLETLKAENEKLRKAAREVINLTSTIRGKGCGILALEAAVGYLSDAMTAPDTKGE